MKKRLIDYLTMTLGCMAVATGVYFFELPNGFVTGGVAGIGIILSKFTPISPSLWILILNMLLLILSFIILGRKVGIRTIYCSALYSVLTYLLEFIIPLDAPLTEHGIIELVYAILLVGMGCAMIFNRGGSSGGTDIIALILRKYTKMDIGIVIFIADLAVCGASFFLFDIETGFLSLIGLLARAFIVDSVIESFNACKYFVIITSERDRVCEYVMHTIERGVTSCEGIGEYTKTQKAMIHTVCSRREAIKLRAGVKEIDPSAFVIITTSSEIIGSGFNTF